MKLRNFLYLNNKIVDDYLSVIDGYVYNEEAQSIATSTENEVKAGGSVKLLKGEGSHAGKMAEEITRSVQISDAAKFDKVFRHLQTGDEDEQIKYFEFLSEETFNKLRRDDFLEVLVTARFSKMKELTDTVTKLNELVTVFQGLTDQQLLDRQAKKAVAGFSALGKLQSGKAISCVFNFEDGKFPLVAYLNEDYFKCKRGNNWSQNSVCRILTNEIYTGKIINGKEEIADFLTGQRKEKDESEWLVTIRPELRIVEDEVFDKAQDILKGRHDSFKITHERQSNKYLFSTLIKCKECGWSFRRTVRQYKNTYVRWVCSGHNGKGADSCPNAVTVDEEELIQALQEYFQEILGKKKKVINYMIKEFQRVYKAKDENIEYEKQLNAELNRLRKSREKYMDMYTDDLISREELNEKIGGMRKEMERLENELKMVSYHLTKGEQLEAILNSTFKQLEDITDVHEMTNAQLKRLIQKIEVDKDGNVDIYLRLIGELGLDETVLIDGDENVEEKKDSHQGNTAESKENRGAKCRADKKTTSDKTATNRHDHT